jgi:hypothetical protein
VRGWGWSCLCVPRESCIHRQPRPLPTLLHTLQSLFSYTPLLHTLLPLSYIFYKYRHSLLLFYVPYLTIIRSLPLLHILYICTMQSLSFHFDLRTYPILTSVVNTHAPIPFFEFFFTDAPSLLLPILGTYYTHQCLSFYKHSANVLKGQSREIFYLCFFVNQHPGPGSLILG